MVSASSSACIARPAIGRQLVGEALGGGVGAVGGGEGVVDIDVAELRQLRDMGRIVLFLALVEAGVLEQQNLAVLQLGDRLGGDRPDAVGGESDGALDDLGDRGRDGPQRIRLVRAALGPAEMGEKDDLGALFREFLDRGGDALDPRRVGHAAVLGGNIEVDAQKDAFADDVGVVERAEGFAHGGSPAFSKSVGFVLRSIAAGA